LSRRDVTYVYIDGFNLYYGCLKGTPHKWLNVSKFIRLTLKNFDIVKIRYFTAKVSARDHDPEQPLRQQQYLKAIATLADVEVTYGHFLQKPVFMPLASNPREQVQVIKTEEKGSDVNLAVNLVNDAHLGRFATAVVVSNDSDLASAITIVRGLGKTVGFIPPHRGQRRPSAHLKMVSSFTRPIRPGVLQVSQFPETLHDTAGSIIRCPPSWR